MSKLQENYNMEIVLGTLKTILDEKDNKKQEEQLEKLLKFVNLYCTKEQKKEIKKQISSYKTGKLISMVESGLLFKKNF